MLGVQPPPTNPSRRPGAPRPGPCAAPLRVTFRYPWLGYRPRLARRTDQEAPAGSRDAPWPSFTRSGHRPTGPTAGHDAADSRPTLSPSSSVAHGHAGRDPSTPPSARPHSRPRARPRAPLPSRRAVSSRPWSPARVDPCHHTRLDALHWRLASALLRGRHPHHVTNRQLIGRRDASRGSRAPRVPRPRALARFRTVPPYARHGPVIRDRAARPSPGRRAVWLRQAPE